tara:strand:- start:279 stop:764 length:486 start_codon:yes stop_codon:yes gene_type:complete
MENILCNTRLKYEDDVLYRWYSKSGPNLLKNPFWKVVKQTPNKEGYSNIGLDGKMYRYHRVVYKVCNPEWDITDVSKENEIDHICGARPLDNRIENLRVLNGQQNQHNNLHWVKGYTYVKRRNKYRAQIRINGKQIYLGHYDTTEEAREAYLNAKKIHHNI